MKRILTFIAIIAFGVAFNNSVLAVEKEYEATNCTYTGNSSDYCNASSGTQNVKVLSCRPGTTDCGYTLPGETIAPE